MAPSESDNTHPRRYQVRALTSEDYYPLRDLEQEIWGQDPAGMLCPYYLRLCTEFFMDWYFISMDGTRPAGYLLNFQRDQTLFCSTFAVRPEYRKTRVGALLLAAMVRKGLHEGIEECRFLVDPENKEARSIHGLLGARVVSEVTGFYQPGDRRLWCLIALKDLAPLRDRYERLLLMS